MANQWMRFKFFDIHNSDEKSGMVFPEALISCSASGRGSVVFGSDKGDVMVFNDRDIGSGRRYAFRAHDGEVIFIFRSKRQDVLLTIGMDRDVSVSAVLNVWQLQDILNVDEKSEGKGDLEPVLANSIEIFTEKLPETPITCVAVLEDFSQCAIGLVDGSILIVEGNLLKSRKINRKLIPAQSEMPVTGLFYQELQGDESHCLFATTLDSVSTFFTQNTRSIRIEQLLFDGCAAKCSALSVKDRMLVVGQPQVVFFFQHDGLGPSYGFEQPKKQIASFNNYLVIVSPDEKRRKDSLLIYDLRNKFSAFVGKFEGIVDVVSEWGLLFVICNGGRKIVRLQEKNLYKKMEMLFKRNLYDIAISLARSQNVEEADIAGIFKGYGDHLYNKSDFDRAMTQYLETIKPGKTFIEPSYVIRKFLDAQRIDNLTTYLEALHRNNCANKDHTTLLLNCFTKSQDIEKLERFIRESEMHVMKGRGPNFDVETAVRVCRQAGYFTHALDLAKQHHRDEFYLKILIEDMNQYNSALDHIAQLSISKASKYLKQYGKVLMANEPNQTTALLKQLCANPDSFRKSLDDERNYYNLSNNNPQAEDFVHIFVGKPTFLQAFLEYIVNQLLQAREINFNTLLELYLRANYKAAHGNTELREMNSGSSLQGLIADEEGDGEEFEFEEKQDYPDKIMRVLTSGNHYNSEHALLLMKLYKFTPGILFLYQKLHLYSEILQHYMEDNQYDQIIEACIRFEEYDSELWLQALGYFASRSHECEDEIKNILQHVDSLNLISPLLVVRMLGKNKKTTIGVVKDYLIQKLERENALIEADEKDIQQYQEQTAKMREDIHEIKTSARTFQNNKCFQCKTALDLPAIHFLCMKHSYHLRCLEENDQKCPECEPEYRQVIEIKQSMQESMEDHEPFLKMIRDLGFSAVAEYFGRGLLEPPEDGMDDYY